MIEAIPRSKSRKVNGYIRRALALDAIQRRRAERYDRHIRPLDAKRDALIAEVATRARALSGGQAAQAQRLLREIKSRSGNCAGVASPPGYLAPACLTEARNPARVTASMS